MSFSERMGHKVPRAALQLDSLDKRLRTALFNSYYALFQMGESRPSSPRARAFMRRAWVDFFRNPAHKLPLGAPAVTTLAEWFDELPWNEVYDLIEFTSASAPPEHDEAVNSILLAEGSGYRIVSHVVTALASAEEISSIEDAIGSSGLFEPASQHLQRALSLMSDRKEPDFRNAIKESISAVESACRVVASSPKATLADALKTLKTRNQLHPALESAWQSLYGYTSDKDGIRHAIMTDPKWE
jgi:hypothetical protein